MFFILLTLQQAVRVVSIAMFLKQLWHLIVSLRKGRSAIVIAWHSICGGDMAQEVRAVIWQSEGCRFDPTLGVSQCP